MTELNTIRFQGSYFGPWLIDKFILPVEKKGSTSVLENLENYGAVSNV